MTHYPCIKNPATGLINKPVGAAMTETQAQAYLRDNHRYSLQRGHAAVRPVSVIDRRAAQTA